MKRANAGEKASEPRGSRLLLLLLPLLLEQLALFELVHLLVTDHAQVHVLHSRQPGGESRQR
jgi:hypothetical protein